MTTLSIVSLHCILLSVACINVLFCSCVESVSYLRTVVDGSASDSPTESPWNYGCIDGLNGPSHWGELSPEWAICDQGKSQSPIVIQTGALETSNQLTPLNSFPSGASLQTETATATIQKNIFKLNIGGWSLLLDSIRYDLVQIHFHTPAEHRINGGITSSTFLS
ncbi:hypothetical protein O6H91_22G026500 [Diphasiastrum complanatum]|uniref:Uncharacterized protein n=1 Tax=Diphasiastrum complanatum TaxID=34168 RepID=A0ACC2ADX5_DIPCM|nr:hypothetical protein O6H91_22G026500 [Diphasiastrum complanatum]